MKFKRGTVVVFDPESFNPEYWNGLTEEEKIRSYGDLGYGQEKKKFFVFLMKIKQCPGHCVLIDMDDGHIETMRHTADFRKAKKSEL